MALQPRSIAANIPTQDDGLMPPFQMNEKEFHELQELVYKHTGIVIKDHKRYLLVNRLTKRLRHLGIHTFSEYLNYVTRSPQGRSERVELIDAVTTNKTDFYREIKHFHYLEQKILPGFIQNSSFAAPFKVWSAASSTGEEPYTISILLTEYFSKHQGRRFEILGTDISETVLRQCVAGEFAKAKTYPVPPHLLKKYFTEHAGVYKAKPELVKSLSFKKLNLQQNFPPLMRGYDVVFCRNVMIYFDKETQEKIVNKQFNVLKPGGYLFIGHSETLHGMNTQYEYILPSIYRRPLDQK